MLVAGVSLQAQSAILTLHNQSPQILYASVNPDGYYAITVAVQPGETGFLRCPPEWDLLLDVELFGWPNQTQPASDDYETHDFPAYNPNYVFNSHGDDKALFIFLAGGSTTASQLNWIEMQTKENVWPAASAGFGVGLLWFGFGWKLRLAKKIPSALVD